MMNDRDSNLARLAIADAAEAARAAFAEVASEYNRPSAIYRPVLSRDGNKWIALYGEDLQVGCVGVGDSPALAMWNFDRAFEEKVKS